ncbi:MAG: ABC transporter permease [Christensenellales bacterium]|jgi:ribose transport system permease protein
MQATKSPGSFKRQAMNWLAHQWGVLVRAWQQKPLFSITLALLVLIVLQTVSLGFNYPTFGEWFLAWLRNIINVLRNNASVGIIALGMTFVIISGGIDLAVGSTMVAIGAVVMELINIGPHGILKGIGITGLPAYLIGIAAGILMGIALGEITGYLIANKRLPPFIATLGMMKILRSVTQFLTQKSAPIVPKAFLNISNLRIGGEIVLPIIYWLILAVVLHMVSRHTAFGRQVYAIGSNERASRLSGIHVKRVKRHVYTLMGAIMSVPAIIQISYIGGMDYANAGAGSEMNAIAAVIVGGTSMAGGRGSIMGTVLGILTLAVMDNTLNLVGVPAFLREAFKGLIVVAAVLLQRRDSGSE